MALSISNVVKNVGTGLKNATASLVPGLLPIIKSAKTKTKATPTIDDKYTWVSNTPTTNKTSTYTPVASTYAPSSPSTSNLNSTYSVPTRTDLSTPSATFSNPFQESIRGLLDIPKKKDADKLSKRVIESASISPTIGKDARELSEKYGSEIARIGKLGEGAAAGHLSTGTNVVGSGNAAIASQSASQRMNALAQGLASELQGTGQQLSAQEQQTQGLGTALSGALTQQGQQISGLQTVAGQLAPNVAGYGQTVFDPYTGTYMGGGDGLNPTSVASQLANNVLTGRMTYEQAVQSMGYAGGAGQQFLNNALQQTSGGGFNAPLSSAQIAGQAGVIGSLPEMRGAENAAEGLKDIIVTYLADNPKLNPSALVKANFINAWVNGELSDPKYQTLFNLLNEYTNTLTPILGVGGSTTNLKTQIAQDFIDAGASGKSIAEVLEGIQNMSKSKIRNLESGALGGGVQGSPYISGNTQGTGSGGEWDF